jgi:hypothetical protein
MSSFHIYKIIYKMQPFEIVKYSTLGHYEVKYDGLNK